MNDIAHTEDHTIDDAMGETVNGRGAQRPVTSRLHRGVYLIVVGLSIWTVLSIWLFASNSGITNWLLFVVSGFIFVVVSLVSILSRVGRRAQADQPPLREWAHSDFEIGQGGDRSRLSSPQAATLLLLPLAAVAFGMTLFGVVFLTVEHLSA